jgi:hypothetical protein
MHGRTDDQHVGWRVDRAGNREVWTLNDSASQGEYEGPTASHGSSLTRISLKDQKVAVEWLARDGSSLGKTPPTAIGAGYIPEGLTPLVIRLVMQKGQDASFTTILNEESIVNGQVNFSAVKMSPKGRMVQVQTQTYKGPLVAQYFLDEKGRVTGIKQGNGELIMVTGDDLLRRFPDDKPLRGLAEEPEVPLTPE